MKANESRKIPYRQIALLLSCFYLLIWGWMWTVRRIFPDNPPTIHEEMYKGVKIETHPWLEVWQRWDVPHYQAIAERGYQAFETALFTPPLFPALIRLLTPVFNGNTLVAGLFVSALALWTGMVGLYQLAMLEWGKEQDAFRVLLMMISFPTAFFLAAPYNESVYLAGAILSLYHVQRGNWRTAGLWGAWAALARITGVLLILPLSYAAWQAWRQGQRKAWYAPGITALGALAFPVYVWIFLGKAPTEILRANYARGGYLTIPGLNLLEAIIRIQKGMLLEENILELFFLLLFILFTPLIFKHLPRIYGIYSLTLLIFFLSRMGFPQPLVSASRYVIEIFPAFMLLAIWGRAPHIRYLILAFSWFGLLFLSAQFAIWGWAG